MMERHEAYWHLHELWSYVGEEYREALTIAMHDIEFVDLMPKDMVAVVRCKECKHNYGLTHGGEYCSVDILCEYWATDGMHENDYCSRGKRKDGETNG